MKTIGIDARLYSQTGVGIYIQNLLHELQLIKQDDIHFIIYLMQDDFNKIVLTNPNFTKRVANILWHSFEEQILLKHILEKDNLDLVHFTYFSYPILYTKPFITTIHDLTNFSYKTGKASTKNSLYYEFKYFVYRKVVNRQISMARFIITPTKTIKNEITRLFTKINRGKIIPIYEGVDTELTKTSPDISISSRIPKKYFLYVGNFYPHKNVEFLITTFANFNPSYHLILRGRKDFFTTSIHKLIHDLHLENRVQIWEEYSRGQMAYLYEHCVALVQAPLFEGFGLPLIEAAWYKKPIICSDIPVFRELWGDSVNYFDPSNSKSLLSALEMVAKNPTARDYSTHLKNYSFKKMAQDTFSVYKKALLT